MLTSLLAPKGSRSAKPMVEDLSVGKLNLIIILIDLISGVAKIALNGAVLSCNYPSLPDISKACSESVEDEEEDDEEFDWQIEQEVYTECSEEELRALQKYGFGNQRSGVFARLQVRSTNNLYISELLIYFLHFGKVIERVHTDCMCG